MDVRDSGFKQVTRLTAARERLLEAVDPIDRTDRVSVGRADGRVLAEPVDSLRDVPGYRRAAMDGWAVRAEDTFGASDRSPAVLREGDEASLAPGEAVRVHTGSPVPEGADAVVMVEDSDTLQRGGGTDVELFDAVAVGENVAPVGEDIERDQRLFEPGHRLRPSDLGLLRAAGLDAVRAYERPTVGVVPTGDEVVERDPEPGEVIGTNGLTVSRLAERWGAVATERPPVPDDREALRAAVERDLTKDVIVTTGGSSVGERDLVPEVVDELGEVLVHGVALKPGHPVALGTVHDTPVVLLPGYPVACIVNAVQFLRPVLKHRGHLPLPAHPTTEARLDGKIRSEPGVRTFARVRLEDGEGDNQPAAVPVRSSGAGVLSSVALADGWVVVPEGREGIPEGETVAVEDWEPAA
jgi:molybdopterin molybdotransferase